MAFNTAITGIKAAQIELDVTGNNIANTSTVGYKAARTEFSDIFTTVVVGAGSSNTPGSGVSVSDIAQDFSAGTIQFTNSNLDLAIDGSGFFQLNDGQGGISYTRAGGFELDKDGNVISKSGKFLQGYELDAAGNQLPIGNLRVSETQSPPSATDAIDLSFNLDASEDANELVPTYDPDNAASYSFSTTSRSYDSLGNEHFIKYDMVGQGAVRERQTVTFSGTFPVAAGSTITVAGVDITTAGPVTNSADLAAEIVANATAIEDAFADGRIADISQNAAGDLQITYKSSAADVEDIAITMGAGFAGVTSDIDSDPDFAANEVQALTLDGTFPTTAGTITLGTGSNSYEIPIDAGMDEDQVIARILANQNQILDAFPAIDSLVADTASTPPQVLINYKPEEGDVAALAINEGASGIFNGSVSADVIETGDNSYEGVYQMYAYLNGTQLLDIGKAVPPGAVGAGGTTEPGAILVTFEQTSGILKSVNGMPTSASGVAPELTILNADPANPNTDITLDLTGTTQFGSPEILNSVSQNGYAKGDLIGIAFADNGTMVASFSNGENTNLGIVALATFANQAGLQSVGNSEWGATLDSGQAVLNPPGTGLNGYLSSSALEQSNVDLSEELVALIEAQRNFQANSKTLQTENSVTQTILQIS